MTFVLLTRHAHHNADLGQHLMVGDLVSVEDAVLAEKLLAMRGGIAYAHSNFQAFSGSGFPHFSPVNFSLETLALELSKLQVEAKVVSKSAPKEEPVVAEEEAVSEEAALEEAAPAKPRARKQ
jgi:hypothetical protein